MPEKLYIVKDGKKTSKPVSEDRIHKLFKASKITCDATITQVGTVFGIPVLDFLDEDEASQVAATPLVEIDATPELVLKSIPVDTVKNRHAKSVKSKAAPLATYLLGIATVLGYQYLLGERTPVAVIVDAQRGANKAKQAPKLNIAKELIREYLAENTNTGDWTEVKWFEPKTLTRSDYGDIDTLVILNSRKTLRSFPVVEHGMDYVYVRLKYRSENVAGAMVLIDTVFRIHDSRALTLGGANDYVVAYWDRIGKGEDVAGQLQRRQAENLKALQGGFRK